LYLTMAFFRVIRLVRGIGVDVLISLGGHAYSGLVIAIAARLLHKRSVVRISEPTRHIVQSRYRFGAVLSCLVRVMEQMTFFFSDLVISNRDMVWYSSKIVSKQRLLSQGVDLSLFNPGVVPIFQSEAFPKLITVARLEEQKNIGSVIRAVQLLRERHPKILYYIVGSGPYEAVLRNRVIELGINDHVRFHGYANLETIPALLRSCDVFVLPSFIEGLPSAVLEAMACGLPTIVGSIRYGWKEWFADQENVLMVRGNPESIAEAVEKLISNKELRGKLIANGLRCMTEFHDSSSTKIKFTSIVQQLLKNL